MPVLLVRHAKAAGRRDWDGADRERPLTGRGEAQAEALVDVLAPLGVQRILTSPYTRCVETVRPLAEKLDLDVECRDALGEAAGSRQALPLLRALDGVTTVLCSHGDVIPELVDALVAEDGMVLCDPWACAKGSTWVLEEESGRFVRARYLPPAL